MQTPKVEVEQEPPFAELAENESVPPSLLTFVLAEYARSPGIASWMVLPELMLVLSAGDVRRYILNKLAGRKEKVLWRRQTLVPVGVYWLDLPRVDGASGSIEVAKATETTVSAKVRVAGIGGGGAAKITVTGKVGDSNVTEPETLVCSVPAIVEGIQVTQNGIVGAPFSRVTEYAKNMESWTATPIMMPRKGLGPEERRFSWVRSEIEGTFDAALEIAKGVAWEFSGQVSIPHVEFGPETTGSYTRTVNYSYKLPKRYGYSATSHANCPGYFWHVDPSTTA